MNQHITLFLFSLTLAISSGGQDIETTTTATKSEDSQALKSFFIDDFLKENQNSKC